jgi:hypothetical protein
MAACFGSQNTLGKRRGSVGLERVCFEKLVNNDKHKHQIMWQTALTGWLSDAAPSASELLAPPPTLI